MTLKNIEAILKNNDKKQLIALFFDEELYHLEESEVIALFTNPDVDLINSLLIANRNTDPLVYKDFYNFLDHLLYGDDDDDDDSSWYDDYYIYSSCQDYSLYAGFNFPAKYYHYIYDELPELILKKIETLEIKDIEILLWLQLDTYLTVNHVLSLTDNAIKKFIKAYFMIVNDYLEGEYYDERRKSFQWVYKKTLAKHFKQLIEEKILKNDAEEIYSLILDGWLENIEKKDLLDLMEDEDLHFLDKLVKSYGDEYYGFSQELNQLIFDHVLRNLPPAEKKFLLELQPLLTHQIIYVTYIYYPTGIPTMLIHDNHVNKLNLENCKLKKLPDSIGDLKHLEYLNLSYNELEEIPETIGRLKNLKILDVNFNKLIKLPDSIGELINLEELLFNYLMELPSTIWNLKKIDPDNQPYTDTRRLKATALSKIYRLKFLESQKDGNESFTFNDAFKLYLAGHDLSELGDQLLDLLRFKIRLDIHIFAANPGVSKYGGDPDVPKNFNWPFWRGKPLDFLLQINLADLKHFEDNQIPFKEGLLHVFFNASQETNDKNGWKITYTNEKKLVRMKNPLNKTNRSVVLTLFKDISLPTPWAKSVGEILPSGKQSNYENLYKELFDLNFHKTSHWMFGFPFELAGPGMELKVELASKNIDLMNFSEDEKKKILQLKEDNWVLLFLLGSDSRQEWSWQQGGILYIWISKNDLKKGNFENVMVLMESKSYSQADFTSVKQLKEECSTIPFDDIPITKSQIRTFLNELAGENACQYESSGFRCGGKDHEYSREILDKMKILGEEQEKFLEKCREFGGGCDCEILMNAAERLLGEYTPW